MARVVTGQRTWLDRIINPIDNAIYFLIGRRTASQAMDWRAYTVHMLMTNMFMAVIIYLVLSFQNYLPLNQLNFGGVEPFLAFNTAISFVTNTNWQAYGGRFRRCRISARWVASPFRCSRRPRQALSWRWPGFAPSR